MDVGVSVLKWARCDAGLAVPGYQVFVEAWRRLSEFSGSGGWGKEKKIANER